MNKRKNATVKDQYLTDEQLKEFRCDELSPRDAVRLYELLLKEKGYVFQK